jgi:hypothetical protein
MPNATLFDIVQKETITVRYIFFEFQLSPHSNSGYLHSTVVSGYLKLRLDAHQYQTPPRLLLYIQRFKGFTGQLTAT